MRPAPLSPAWRRALPGFLVLLLGVLLLYRQTGLAMVEIWYRSETFAHAFVVPPISLWLIWRQRAVLAQLTPRPQAIFLLPMAAAGLLWLVGDLAAVNAATQFAFTAMLVLTVPAALGWAVARSIAFPLLFLFFAVPFGEFLMPLLMETTADFTVAALRLSGIPVYREGLQFIIPSGNWSVVEACSGIRYLMASVMVGCLFAYLNYRSTKRRWIFVGIATVLPLVANWLRAYMIVMLGHLSSNQLAVGADHLIYGWVFFGIIMLALFMIGARWAEPDAPPPAPPAIPPAAAITRRGAAVWVALGLLIAAPLATSRALDAQAPGQPLSLAAPDFAARGWPAAEAPPARYRPAFEFPAAELQTAYSSGDAGAAVGLYIGYYRQQGYRSKLVSSNNVLLRSNDRHWAQVDGGVVEGTVGETAARLRTAELLGSSRSLEAIDGQRLRVWQLYWVDGRLTSADWQAKLYGVLGRLLGRGDDAAVVVVYADKGQAGEGDALLRRFLQDNGAGLQGWLQQTREAGRAGSR
ncbi:exosortase A [Roseateles violae]|uniref:Exosortase A n=1 Tax=Roseateles violae TaxID=3058042 RepID=A0ABT8DQZ9_9BURK|nr:exosortase A [Pelomonas sp. PFR6]MDN3920451.1 exosortase A [Pelomonas sp. PFR6]